MLCLVKFLARLDSIALIGLVLVECCFDVTFVSGFLSIDMSRVNKRSVGMAYPSDDCSRLVFINQGLVAMTLCFELNNSSV